MSYSEFAFTMRILCELFDCSISSGIRSKNRNTIVGGATGSRHMLKNGGKAADLVPDNLSTAHMGRVVKACQKLGLFAQNEGDHIHTHDYP